jgi:hypothetical protein
MYSDKDAEWKVGMRVLVRELGYTEITTHIQMKKSLVYSDKRNKNRKWS